MPPSGSPLSFGQAKAESTHSDRVTNDADLVGAASWNEDTISRPLLKMPWLHPILLLQLSQVLGTQVEFLQAGSGFTCYMSYSTGK